MFPTADTEDISRVTSITEKSSTSSDAQQSSTNTQVATEHNNRETTLNMLIKEMVFCIALALTTYGALHNTSSKVSKHPQAVRFFNSDSVVTDWYRGQLSNALSVISNTDVSFVMYYAPWDAESQYVRGEFEKAAMVLHDQVHFSAINCWNPGSECRLQHYKIPSWPILMAYTVNSRGVLYKGPRDAHSMVNFIEMIRTPLKRVSSTEDLVNLLSICDALAVGYTPLADTSKYYNIWYHVALKTREFDSVGEICFASVTSEELAMDLGVEIVPNVRLMLWNDTKEYITEEGSMHLWNESTLMLWVLENFAQPVARIIPLWKKSFSFERYVDGNPILILFTPLNPLYEQLPSYTLLREVAMEYYNCNNNNTQWTSELIKLQQVQRLLYEQKNFMKFCKEFKFKKTISKQSHYYKKEVESRNNKYPWNNTTQKSQKSGVFNFLVKRGIEITKALDSVDDNTQLLSSMDWLQECSTKTLPAEKSFYENHKQCQTFEDKFIPEKESGTTDEDIETTMLPLEDDPLSPENLIQDNVKHYCKLMKFAHQFSPPIYPTIVAKKNLTNIKGLACVKNFSLYMIAVDSIQNYHFAESLGIDISSKKDKTAVVILDSKHESQYLLSEEYNAKSVRDFIYNFTHKNLKRSLRTHVDDAVHTHYFGSNGKADQTDIKDDSIHIIDLTTKSFRRVVNTPGTLTLVCVCGGECGALAVRALAEAARRARACGLRVRVARLDALRHDLAWHYTVHRYPTLFAFPADRSREAESVSYPAGERVTSGGVLALVLRSLPAPQHLRVRIQLCAMPQAIVERKTCLKDIKDHVTTVIGRNLKYWRRAEDADLRDVLLKRLQYLHQVSLDLSLLHYSDLTENSKRHSSLLNSLDTLSKHWGTYTSILRNNTVSLRKNS